MQTQQQWRGTQHQLSHQQQLQQQPRLPVMPQEQPQQQQQPQQLPRQQQLPTELIPIKPGIKTYSKAHIPMTLILSDSTIGQLTAKEVRRHLDKDTEEVFVNRHPGATASEISYYSKLSLDELRPERVIVFAGSNDISRSYQSTRSVNEYEVVNNILNIARNAKNAGAKSIYISSVLSRSGYEFKNIIKRVNNLLDASCVDEGFYFLDHSDVTTSHLGYDVLHCNRFGYCILKMNILRCFTSFNSFICDFTCYTKEPWSTFVLMALW